MTFIPDTRTLAIALAITLFIQFAFLLFHYRATKTYPGFSAWVACGGLGFFGMLLLGFRGLIDDFISIVIAQTVLAASILLLVAGLRKFVGRTVHAPAYIAILALLFVLHYVATFIYPSYTARTLLFSTTFAVASAVCFDIAARLMYTVLPGGNRLVEAVLLLQTAWYVVRSIVILSGTDIGTEFIAPSWFNAATLLAQIGFSTALLVGLVILNAQRVAQDLVMARDEIKTLQGIIPICAWCKKIRHDSGSWQQIEEYVKAHADVDFSHGICPDCLPKYFEGMEMPTLPPERDR